MLTKIITSSPSSITAPVPPAKGNSIGELVAARPARAHPGRLGIKKTGEFSNVKIGENYSATDSPSVLREKVQGRAARRNGAWLSIRGKPRGAPLRGWAARGARLVAKVPHGHWKTMTFAAALRHDRIEAPFVIDGPINGECFNTYIEKVLAPALAPGDLVIMDNLGSHKGKAIRRAIRSAGAKLFFLPKYSRDLNPIEQVFAKLKQLLRKAAARSFEAVIAAIGQLLGTYTTQECTNYFTNAGYGQT
jgi:transposase